jgi:hypothetical protein
MSHAYSARDLLTDRKLLVDSTLPPLVFVGLNGWLGLQAAAFGSLALAGLLVVVRLLRRQRVLYAFGGVGGVALGVGVALWSGKAEGFFVPGIYTNLAMAFVCIGSILVRRPFIALAGAGIYRWPLEWYWHELVRPAYSEITWVWVAFYFFKAGLQWALVEQGQVGWLAVARVATGWPLFAALLVVTYAYISWRLNHLGAPTVEEWKARRPV